MKYCYTNISNTKILQMKLKQITVPERKLDPSKISHYTVHTHVHVCMHAYYMQVQLSYACMYMYMYMHT